MSVIGQYPVPAEYGQRVHYRSEHEEGEGVFTLCWLGIEETWDVLKDDGTTIHLFPCFGDSMERK